MYACSISQTTENRYCWPIASSGEADPEPEPDLPPTLPPLPLPPLGILNDAFEARMDRVLAAVTREVADFVDFVDFVERTERADRFELTLLVR